MPSLAMAHSATNEEIQRVELLPKKRSTFEFIHLEIAKQLQVSSLTIAGHLQVSLQSLARAQSTPGAIARVSFQ